MSEGRREPSVILKTADDPGRAVSTVTQEEEMAVTLSPSAPSKLSKAEVEDKVSMHLQCCIQRATGLWEDHGMTCPDPPREAERLPTHSMWESACWMLLGAWGPGKAKCLIFGKEAV